MSKIVFSRKCELPPEKLIEIALDYKNILKLFYPMIKGKIIEKNENQTIIEESFTMPVLKQEIKQKSIHKRTSSNKMQMNIIEGPAKGTKIDIEFIQEYAETKINIIVDLKLGLKYRLISSIIKQKYENQLNNFLNKIINLCDLTSGNSWKNSLKDNGDALLLSKKNCEGLLFYGWENANLAGIFGRNSLEFMPVKDEIVIDIGASVGDSPIYFVKQGAKKVIALEPFPGNYEIGKKNVDINNLSEQIEFVLAGCSDKNSKIFVDGESSGASLVLKNEGKGKREIPTMTLKSILDEFNVSSAVLKLNCEGCEYETILNTPENILKKFSYIFLEYHHGRKNLKEKLERSGFHVIAKENHDSKHKGKGYIYAKLK